MPISAQFADYGRIRVEQHSRVDSFFPHSAFILSFFFFSFTINAFLPHYPFPLPFGFSFVTHALCLMMTFNVWMVFQNLTHPRRQWPRSNACSVARTRSFCSASRSYSLHRNFKAMINAFIQVNVISDMDRINATPFVYAQMCVKLCIHIQMDTVIIRIDVMFISECDVTASWWAGDIGLLWQDINIDFMWDFNGTCWVTVCGSTVCERVWK